MLQISSYILGLLVVLSVVFADFEGLPNNSANAEVESRPQVRITAVEFFDEGSLESASLPSLDVMQTTCDINNPSETEPFFDSFVKLNVINTGLYTVTFKKLLYTLRGAEVPGVRFRSRALAPVSGAEVAGDDTTSGVLGYFLKASSGTKKFTGSDSAISSDLGFKNVTFRLRGRTSEGERVTVSGRTAIHFGEIDRCD